MDKFPVDGSKSLADQRNTLRFIELSGPSRLLTYTKKTAPPGTTAKVNVATFEDVPLGVSVPDLVLVEVPAGQNAVSVISDQLSHGKTIVFHERVFVSGVEKEVLGFR
jgi:hypothetical protein